MSGQLVVPPGARLKKCAWLWQGTINTMIVILQGNVKEMQWSFVQFMVFIIIYHMYLCSSLHFEASQVGSRLKVRRIWNGPAFSSQTSRYILFEHFPFKFHDIPEYPGKNHSASNTCSSKPQAVAGRRSSHLPVLPMKPSHKRPQWMAWFASWPRKDFQTERHHTDKLLLLLLLL
jgi:hypothetical protein